MTPGLMKMWIAFIAIALMFISSGTIALSRKKLNGVWRGLTAVFAYVCMIVAGVLMIFVVFTGPSS